MKLNRYPEFINEGIFRKIKKNKNSTSKKDQIKSCLVDILEFLEKNSIHNWSQFLNISPFKREVINKIIDSNVDSISEVKEITFFLKLELCDRMQLRDLISEYEREEEYEKCSLILKKLNEK
jgi:hypothetical protein